MKMIRKIFLKIRNWQTTGVILLFLVFFLLRLYRLGYHDFWYDEIGAIDCAQNPWTTWNAPLYGILLHFWIKLFKISEFTLRFPSLIFSFLSILLTFLLGKALFNRKVGLFASIIMGLCPFHLWYAQEARDYSMVLFLGVLSSYLFYQAIKTKKIKFWILFLFASVMGVYTNYFFIFILIFQLFYVVIFFQYFRLRLKHIITLLSVGIFFLPYHKRFLYKFSYIWNHFWIPEPRLKSLVITIENFILGYNAEFVFYVIADILAIILCIVSLSKLKDKLLRPTISFCLILFLFPIITVFIFSKVFFSVYLDRALIIFSPYFYLFLSLGIVSIKRTYVRTSCLVILFPLLLFSDYAYYKDWMPTSLIHHMGTYIKKPIKPLVRYIEAHVLPDDIVAFGSSSVQPSVAFYTKQKTRFYYFFDPLVLDSNWQEPYQESEYCIPTYKISNLKFRKIWLVASNWPRDDGLDENSMKVKMWLERNYKLEFNQVFEGTWLLRYTKR